MSHIHTCSYHCDRPECIKAQRDELREKLAALESQPVPVEPVAWWDGGVNVTRHKGRPEAHGWVISVPLYPQSAIDSLQSAQKLAQEERDRLKSYWLAIDNRMVVLHLGTADSFDADTCMNKILEWETTIALDPQVSRPAQELKDTHLRRAEKAESINRRMVELLKEPSEGMKDAAYKVVTGGYSDLCSKDEISRADCLEIFRAMAEKLLKEAGE